MNQHVFPSRARLSGIRSPKLIIIACEGTNTEKIYFDDMAAYYRNKRVHVEVLKHDSFSSSPRHILSCLDEYKNTYKLVLDKDDELWLVIDRDNWTLKELSEVATVCQQKCHLLGVSNPCFEFWLLLHIKSLDDYNDDQIVSIAKNKRVNFKKTFLEIELAKILGNYNKHNPDTSKFLPFVESAISRARELDTNPKERWPNKLGTRVYLLAKSILKE